MYLVIVAFYLRLGLIKLKSALAMFLVGPRASQIFSFQA